MELGLGSVTPVQGPVDSGTLWEVPGETEPVPGEGTQGFTRCLPPTVTAPTPVS